MKNDGGRKTRRHTMEKTPIRTEADYGAEYAVELVRDGTIAAGIEINVEDAVHGICSIPSGDEEAMRDAGIVNPDAREYWRGYNAQMSLLQK